MQRGRHTRSGSVLVLVVAVLVILALMATAFITTARMDRQMVTGSGAEGAIIGTGLGINEAKMNSAEAAVVDAVRQTLLKDLFHVDPANGQPLRYRPPMIITGPQALNYENWDSDETGAQGGPFNDNWLASRLPDLPIQGPFVFWPNISFIPENVGGQPVDGFRSPYQPGGAAANWPPDPIPRKGLVPHHVRITYPPGFLTPTGLDGRTRIYPAFTTVQQPHGPDFYLAADADGDGIADSALFRLNSVTPDTISYLPPAQPQQVTYWAAVRIIDNAAAINVNTAWSRDRDFNFNGQALPSYGMFRSNIGLVELLDPNPLPAPVGRLEIEYLNEYRFQGSVASDMPTDDRGIARTDYRFSSQGEALEMQLARRLGNPGVNRASNMKYMTFGDRDSGALAYRFCLLDPAANRVELENRLGSSLLSWAPNYALNNPGNMFRYYGADHSLLWYHQNFNADLTSRMGAVRANPPMPLAPRPSSLYVSPGTPIRSLLTAGNPMANTVPAFDMAVLPPTVLTAYPNPDPDRMPDFNTDFSRVGRTCINTATFGELWRAFWCVMAVPENPGVVPPALANRFYRDPFRNTGSKPSAWNASHQMLVRAAIAAVNAIDLRDSDFNVTSRRITIPVGGTNYDIMVYGTERQPYITEAVVEESDVGVTYVAIELHNPYPVPLSLNNWKLATLDRVNTPMIMAQVHQFGNVTIPANGYLVVRSSTASPSGLQAPVGPIEEQGQLSNAKDKELILLRPRAANGSYFNGTLPNNGGQVNESSNLYDLVPADSVDLRGIEGPTAGGTETSVRYVYMRPTGPGNAWKFVYPGPYSSTSTRRMEGLKKMTSSDTDYSGSLGQHNPRATYGSNTVFTIQLANVDWAGFNGMIDPVTGNVRPAPYRFPFGGFARDGDILQVPFIGGYRINAANTPASFVEINSVTMDSVFAETQNVTDDGRELGRFCAKPNNSITDYDWAADLFDYLTAIQNPKDDFLPNVDPSAYPGGQAPMAVSNSGGEPNLTEDNVPVEGRININTAPWQVLRMLPLVMRNDGTGVDEAATTTLAQLIVRDRAQNGPFRSIFDLNRIPQFQTPAGMPANPTQAQGDISPITGDDGVNGDFERKYIQMIRLSNLITTRSDSFTCYIVVQAWQGAGTPLPVLLSERRSAYIIDRSQVNQQEMEQDALKIIGVTTE